MNSIIKRFANYFLRNALVTVYTALLCLFASSGDKITTLRTMLIYLLGLVYMIDKIIKAYNHQKDDHYIWASCMVFIGAGIYVITQYLSIRTPFGIIEVML